MRGSPCPLWVRSGHRNLAYLRSAQRLRQLRHGWPREIDLTIRRREAQKEFGPGRFGWQNRGREIAVCVVAVCEGLRTTLGSRAQAQPL
jgi:hypothetical protein